MQWGGAPQQAYEQLRAIALAGGETGMFGQRGMSLLLRGKGGSSVRSFVVSRVRAPVRAGQFLLEPFLWELGVAGRVRLREHGAARRKEGSL